MGIQQFRRGDRVEMGFAGRKGRTNWGRGVIQHVFTKPRKAGKFTTTPASPEKPLYAVKMVGGPAVHYAYAEKLRPRAKKPAPSSRPATTAANKSRVTAKPLEGPQYYELSEGGSHKFWEVSVDGARMNIRFGRIGTEGQQKSKTFPSRDRALAEAAKLISEKTNKGYLLSRPPAKSKASELAGHEVTDVKGAIAALEAAVGKSARVKLGRKELAEIESALGAPVPEDAAVLLTAGLPSSVSPPFGLWPFETQRDISLDARSPDEFRPAASGVWVIGHNHVRAGIGIKVTDTPQVRDGSRQIRVPRGGVVLWPADSMYELRQVATSLESWLITCARVISAREAYKARTGDVHLEETRPLRKHMADALSRLKSLDPVAAKGWQNLDAG